MRHVRNKVIFIYLHNINATEHCYLHRITKMKVRCHKGDLRAVKLSRVLKSKALRLGNIVRYQIHTKRSC